MTGHPVGLVALSTCLTVTELTWNDDVSEAEHGHVGGAEAVLEEVLREDQLDRRLEALGHGDHHVGAEDPEDVVEEEAAEQDAAGGHVVEVEQLDAVDGEGQPEDVVCDPVLLDEVPVERYLGLLRKIQ